MSSLLIPFKSYTREIGGPSTFMRNLRSYLISQSFDFNINLRRLNESNGIFFPISYDKYILSHFKKNRLPIIQRLDGIFYPSKHGKKYIELNKDIKDIYLNYSTHIIFQSKYCKKQCFKILGKLPKNKHSIIYNGTIKKLFYPHKDLTKSHRDNIINLVTTGNFRNIDMIEPIILSLNQLEGKYKFKLTIIGPIIINRISELISNKNYINYIRKINPKKVADQLRKSDIFIYSHLNPPCPNSVIEAISCGLPVVSFDSGSMSDLLYFEKDLLAPVSNKIFQEYYEFRPEYLKEKIVYAFENLEYLRKRALEHCHLYSFEDTGEKYIKLFDKLVSNPNT